MHIFVCIIFTIEMQGGKTIHAFQIRKSNGTHLTILKKGVEIGFSRFFCYHACKCAYEIYSTLLHGCKDIEL